MTRPIVTAPTTALLLTSDATSGEIGPASLPGPAPLTPSLTLHCRDRVSRKRQAAAPPNAVGCVGGPEAAAAVLAERYLADAADGAHSTAPRATLVTAADVGDGAAASLLFGTDQGPGLLATVAAGLLSGTAAPGTVLLSVTAVPPHGIRSKVPHGTDLLSDGAAAASPLHEVDGALESSAVPVPLADLPSLTAALSKVRRCMATGSAAHCVATLRAPGQGSGSGLTFVAMAPLSTDQAVLRDYAAVAHRSLEAHGEAVRQRRHDVADSTASTRNKSHGQDAAPAPQTVLSRLLPPVAPTLTALCCPADAMSADSPRHAAFASAAVLTLSPALGAPVPPVPEEAAAAPGPPQGPTSLCAQRSEARSGQAAARRESLTAFKALAVAEAAGRATLHAAEDQRRVLIAAKCAHRPSALHAPLVERRVAKTRAAARLTTLTAIGTSTADSATVLAPASVTVDVKGEAHVAKPKRRKDKRAVPLEELGSGDGTDPDAGAPEGGGDGEDLVRLESIPDFGGPLQLRPSLIAAHGPASVDGVHVVVSPMTETRDSTLAGVLRERRRRSSTDDVAAALALSVLSESAPLGALSRSHVGAAGHQGQDNHLTAEGPKAAGSAASTPRAPATVDRVPSLPKLPVSAKATPRATPNATPRATPGGTPRELPVPKGSSRRAPEKATPLPRVASLRNSLAVRAEAQQLLDATPDPKPRGRGKRTGASHLAPIPDRRRASAPAPLSRPARPTPSPAGRPGLAPLTARGQGTGGPQRTASSPAMAHTRIVHRHIGRRADSSSSDGVSPSGERRQRNASKHKSASPVEEELWPGTADDDEGEPPARRPVPAPPSRNRSTQPSPRPSPSASLAEPPALHGAPLGFVPVGTPSTGPEEHGMDPPPGAALDPSLRASDSATPTSPLPPGVPYGGLVSEEDAAATLEGLRRRTDEQGRPPNAVAFEAAETWSTATGPGTGTTTPLVATPAQVTAQPPTAGQPTARAPSEPKPPLPPTAASVEIPSTSPPRGLTLDVFGSPELGEHVDSESTTRSSSPAPAETEARAVEDPSRRRSSVSSAGSFTGPGSRRGSTHSLSNGVSFTTPLDRIQQARQRAEARADRRKELQRQLSRSSSAASMSRESTPGAEAPLSGQPLQSDTSGDTTQAPGPSVPWYLRQQSAQPPAAEAAPEPAASYEPPTHKSPLRDVAKDRAPHVDMERTPRAAAVEAARRRRESLEAQSAAGPASPELHPAPAPHIIPRMVVTPPPPPPPDTAADAPAVVASPRHEEPKAAPALPSAPTTSTSTPGRSRQSSFRSGRSSGTTSVEGRRGERVVRIVSPTDELPPRAPRRPGPTPPASPPPPREPIPPPLPAPHYGATNAAGAERKPNMNLFSRAAPGGSRDSTPLRPAASPSNEGRCTASDAAPVLGPYTVGAVAAASPCTLRTDPSVRAQGEGPLTRAHFPMRPSALWLSKPPPAGT